MACSACRYALSRSVPIRERSKSSMHEQNTSQQTSRSYHLLHLTPEELAHLPPEELLQACLEFRRLLLTLIGILSTPESSLTLRAVAMDLLYSQAQQLAQGQLVDE